MTPEDVPMWIGIIANFGFPIAITVYLFVRFEKKLDKLETVILQLADVVKSIDSKKDL